MPISRTQKLIQQLLEQITRLQTQLRNQTVYETAVKYLGTDITPVDEIDDEVSCAWDVTAILAKHINIPRIAGTYTLLEYMKNSPRFREVYIPVPGNVAIAATGTGNGKIRGHVFIVGKNGLLLSNNSYTGKFSAHYTIETAKARYEGEGGMKLRFFALV